MNPWIDLNGNAIERTWPGNICHLQAVPEEDILVWPELDAETQMIQEDIQLKNGKSWIVVKLLGSGKAYTEESFTSTAGLIVEQVASGMLYGQSEYNHLQLNNWLFRRWVLLLREVGTGITYIIGHPSKGARCSFSYDNSTSTITKVAFSKQSNCRALLYKGSLFIPSSGSSGTPSTIRMIKEFLVGDVGTIPNGGTEYTHADLINKTVAVYVDGIRIMSSADGDRLYQTFNATTGTVIFSQPLYTAQLITIDYE